MLLSALAEVIERLQSRHRADPLHRREKDVLLLLPGLLSCHNAYIWQMLEFMLKHTVTIIDCDHISEAPMAHGPQGACYSPQTGKNQGGGKELEGSSKPALSAGRYNSKVEK